MLTAFGGRGRIRTAVQGFADLCLATRPRDLLRVCFSVEAIANIGQGFGLSKYFHLKNSF